MKIIGIDPGLKELGWAVVNVSGCNLNGEKSNGSRVKSKGERKVKKIPKIKIVDWGVISTSEKDSISVRLCSIGGSISAVLSKHRPEMVGIETPFVWKNPGSALKLGMVVGLCVEAARKYKGSIKFVAPISAKSRVAGSQFASKEKVKKAVMRTIGNKSRFVGKVVPHHVWDAVSIAISSVS